MRAAAAAGVLQALAFCRRHATLVRALSCCSAAFRHAGAAAHCCIVRVRGPVALLQRRRWRWHRAETARLRLRRPRASSVAAAAFGREPDTQALLRAGVLC
jgi:hypothetical protein